MSTSTSTAVNKQSGSSKPSSSSISTGHGYQVQVDPSLLVYGAGGHDLPIDPALFAIEQVVNDVRKGKIKPDVQDANHKEATTGAHHREASSSSMIGNSDSVPQHLGAVDTGLDILDEEFDPALREIVNSLTNAQQSSSILGTNLTQAQAQAAIDAHLSEDHDNGMALKTLEDLERAGFGMINQYPDVPDSYLLPESHTHTTSSPYLPDSNTSNTPLPDPNSLPNRGDIRRRGRPKGSKNKLKPGQIPPPPPPPKEPKKRGRPPKRRTEEELAEIEREKFEKEHGLKRQKGRPRKFPGYLVREMRLKKNRPEYQELLRSYEGSERDHHHQGSGAGVGGSGGHAHSHGHGGIHGDGDGAGDLGDGGGFWTGDMEQSILAAVGNFQETPNGMDQGSDQHNDGEGGGGGGGGEMEVDLEEVPSSRAFEGGGGEMEMRRVFGLPPDTDTDPDHHDHDHDGQ